MHTTAEHSHRRGPSAASVFIALVASAAVAGCLGPVHKVNKSELMRLSQTPPEQRGQAVQVLQGFSSDPRPPEAQPVRSNTVVVVGTHHGGSGGVVRSTAKKSAAKAAKDEAKVWLVIAALAAVTLAASEGARYDGWVRINPMHPLHLYGPLGEYAVVPLAQLDPETAAWARKGVLMETEGPWQHLRRRPLARTGFSYSLYFGAGEQPSIDGSEELGFMSHIQFGYFFNPITGLQFDIGFGWRDNEIGETLFDSRYAAELTFLPVKLGNIHGGVFGQGGIGARFEDGAGDKRDMLLGGGAIVQLELTTRLTISGRAGFTRIFNEVTSDIGIGISVY